MNMNKYLVQKKTLTGLTTWMNDQFKKQTGKPFTTNDVQKYISRGRIPEYLGGNEVESDNSVIGVKLYKVHK